MYLRDVYVDTASASTILSRVTLSSVLLQDVNNDGAADILIGAYKSDPEGSMSGSAYIVFGSTTWIDDTVDLAEMGAAGITLQGAERREYAGYSVAAAGGVVHARSS